MVVEGWRRLIEDPRRFIRRLYIEDLYNQCREVESFIPEQIPWIDALCDPERNRKLCVKPRQVGVTTASQAYLFWKLFTSSRARRCFQQVHEESAVARLCRMVRVMHENLAPEIREPLHVDNQETTEFAHNRAAFARSLAGGVGGQARGWTATDLHATEMAKWKGASSAVAGEDGMTADEEAFNSAMNAIHDPTATIIVESTGNGPRGLFYRLYNQAQTDPKWNFVFVSWLDVKDRYFEPLTDAEAMAIERELDPEEEELVRHHGVSLERIAFRRTKIRTDGMSPLMFQREFPLTPKDPFILFARGWFDQRPLNRMFQYCPTLQASRDAELVVFQPWERGRKYYMGVDTSGGVGEDEAVIHVLRDDLVHCAIWASRWTSPPEQAAWISRIGQLYRRPVALIERNKHGVTVIPKVEELGGVELWTDRDGEYFWATQETKREYMTHARQVIDEGWSTFRDFQTISQLQNIVEKPNGKIEGRGEDRDDRAMAGCLALFAAKSGWSRDTMALDTERDRIARILKLFGGTGGIRR